MAVRPIDAVQVLHDINLHRRPTPVSEFESGFNNGLNQAMWEITHAPTLTQPNEWVSVEDRLPEENVTVLVFNADPHAEKYVLARYRVVVHFGRCWCQFDQEYDSWCASCWKVTHWMPLPQPPKEEAYEK